MIWRASDASQSDERADSPAGISAHGNWCGHPAADRIACTPEPCPAQPERGAAVGAPAGPGPDCQLISGALADQSAFAPVVVLEQSGRASSIRVLCAQVRIGSSPRARPARRACAAAASGGPGSWSGCRRRRRCRGSAARTGGPGRRVHRQVEQRADQPVAGDQQVPVLRHGLQRTESGWYAQARARRGSGRPGWRSRGTRSPARSPGDLSLLTGTRAVPREPTAVRRR